MNREEERTIPFLRRLVDMLLENESIIQFNPGSRNMNGQIIAGRIVVHDRSKVEAEILPRYFNHSSFASLRRQLNYFSFTRVGKDRQHGATYFNQQVIEIGDILNLRRRTVGVTTADTIHLEKDVNSARTTLPDSTVPSHTLSTKPPTVKTTYKKKRVSKGFSNSAIPVIHVHRFKKLQVKVYDAESNLESSLNLYSPSKDTTMKTSPLNSPKCSFLPGTVFHSVSNNSLVCQENPTDANKGHIISVQRKSKDTDVLDGCRALLALGSEE